MRFAYSYTKARYDPRSLLAEIAAALLPTASMDGRGDQLVLTFAVELRPAQVTTLDAVVAAHNPAKTIYEQARADWIATWGPTR